MLKNRWVVGLAALSLSVVAFYSCGSSTPAQPAPPPTPKPTPVPTPTPLKDQLPPGMVCDPTPPPLYGIRLKEHNPRTLDSRPQVINVDNYCARVGFGGSFCFTRREDDPQSVACDYLAVGKASDTGRWGPTWTFNGQPCRPNSDGCVNSPDNQFLVLHYGDGTYLACVAPEVPLSTDPSRPGSRCGVCKIKDGVVYCNEQANGL